ncbi:MAG: hypothetical protein AAF149_24520 [Bacteroidota bacterium]
MRLASASDYESVHKGLTPSGIIWYLRYQMPMLGTHSQYRRMCLCSYLLSECNIPVNTASMKEYRYLTFLNVGAFTFWTQWLLTDLLTLAAFTILQSLIKYEHTRHTWALAIILEP